MSSGITKWASTDGHFRRAPSSFRNHIAKDSEFPPEKGRYWLYVSYACPWAHRTLIVRKLKGLEDVIGLSIVHPFMGEKGWSFYPPEGKEDNISGVIPDPNYDSKFLRELYFRAESDYSGRFTVPVLWDARSHKIVNNESSEIIRMFNNEFEDLIDPKFKGVTYYPEALRGQIEELNGWIYDTVNNGVYKSGFATTQEAYEAAVHPLFKSLDRIEARLGETGDYLIKGHFTEADIRLYTTIVRFDPVYYFHFKCNIGSIRVNYPNIHKWLRELYWKDEAFKSTTNFQHIKAHYFMSHSQINPTRIVPVGPDPNILPL